MKKQLYLPLIFLIVFNISKAQDTIQWASPNVKYMPIGRGFDINFTRVFDTSIESTAEVERLSDADSELKSVENMEYDLKVPIIIHDRTKFLASVEYTYDYFRFKDQENLDYEFYQVLDRKTLRSRKLKLYLVHSLNKKNYLNIRASAALNGNVSQSKDPFYKFAKYSLSVTYGWQKSAYNSYGVGLYLDYTLGRPAVYPVFEWNKSWNERWGFESRLPAKFMMRFTPTEGVRFYGGYNVQGISYRLVAGSEETDLLQEFEVRRSDVMFSLSVEKRIYDFIWVGLQGGLDYNLRVDASDSDVIYQNEDLVSGKLKTAPFVNLSVFVVPTEGLKEMFGYKK